MPLIRVVDFETTGTEPECQVCEVGWTDVDCNTKEIGPTHSMLCRVDSMPPEARAIHHISAAQTHVGLPFDPDQFLHRAQADDVIAFAAHNLDFEKQWLAVGDLLLICTLKVALRVWPDAPAHGNQVLRYWLADQGKLQMRDDMADPPHRAGPDSYVTAHILRAAFMTGTKGGEMTFWTKLPKLLPVCPLGEHRGKPWDQVPWGFLDWMIRKAAHMDADAKWNAQRELDRRNVRS